MTLAESQLEKFYFNCSMRISSPVRLRLYRIPGESVSLPGAGTGSPSGAISLRDVSVQPPTYGVNMSYSFELDSTRTNAGTYWCEIEDANGSRSTSTSYTVFIYCELVSLYALKFELCL